MSKQIKLISHKLIDTLSDGVFSIALTLLGLDVVGLVHKISESEDFNGAMFDNWPTFLAYVLGFVVLFSWWYQYHVTSQYVVGTNAMIVWNHGLTMAWVALMPFGVALLAENLTSHNRKWGIFYFGICLFGQYWTAVIQRIVVGIFKGDTSVTWTDDFFLSDKSKEDQNKALIIFNGVPAVLGIIFVSICFLNPWVALAGYTIYIFTSINPVRSLNRLLPMFAKLIK
ncbi:MAG: DUF1211 domain-containing protein [Actinobacteria bacterium]|uniref:Unannotated protein n=1 Tax=freshwater metagenome TaxID=449393 RepID=A0A6J6FR65_9ZZZZ|nr:DUF1211 domain-containing protein [Actinomycetota bacterium]